MVDASAQDNLGMTILHYVAWSSKTAGEIFQKCCERSQLSIALADDENRSALHFAAQRGNQEVIDHLFCTAPGLDVNRKDSSGSTPLHYAVESRRGREIVQDLLSRGADIQAQDNMGRTPLHRAAMRDNRAALERLRAIVGTQDDGLQTRDRQGMTPLQLATRHRAHAVMAYLTGLPEFIEAGSTRDSMRNVRDDDPSVTKQQRHHLPIATSFPHPQPCRTWATSALRRHLITFWPSVLHRALATCEAATRDSLRRLSLHLIDANPSRRPPHSRLRSMITMLVSVVLVVILLLLFMLTTKALFPPFLGPLGNYLRGFEC